MNHELVLQSANLELQAQAWGIQRKTPILALHGWLDNSSSFKPLGRVLSENYTLALDLAGHGHSQHLPPNITYSLEVHALTILCALDLLGWKKFSILGHSLGAGIGVLLAAAIPERVTHLIMLDALGPPVQPVEGYLKQFLLNIQSRVPQKIGGQIVYKTQSEAIEIRRLVSSSSREAAHLIAERDLHLIKDGFVSRCDRRLQFKSHLSLTEDQCRTLLRAVECPTLLIKAESGLLAGHDLSQRENCLRSLEVIEVAGGHHFHIEEPTSIAPIISQFLVQQGR